MVTRRFKDKYGAELLVKNIPFPTCCLRVTDGTDQAYFIIRPEQADAIIAAIREQLEGGKDKNEDGGKDGPD